VNRKITSLLFISDCTTLVMGTDGGAVYFNSTFAANDVFTVDMTRMGDKSAVAGLTYGPFYHHGVVKPCVFVVLTSGVCGVICLRKRAMIAWTVGPASVLSQSVANGGSGVEDDEDASPQRGLSRANSRNQQPLAATASAHSVHSHESVSDLRVAVSCVTDCYYLQCPRPDPNDMAGQNNASESNSMNPSPAPVKRESTMSRMFSRNSSNPSTASAIGAGLAQLAAPIVVPIPKKRGVPNHLLLILGGHLLTYDLSKFSIVPKGAAAGTMYSGMHADTIDVQAISGHAIVSGTIVNFVEAANRAWMDPVPCFMCVDRNGSITVMSVRNRKAIAHANLLDGVTTQPAHLQSGVMLGSGSAYMIQNEHMLFSSTIYSPTHILPSIHPLPARVKSEHFIPERSSILKTGREQAVAVNKQAVTKRRQSMIALTAGPTDLDKVFSKTRTDALKDSLFAGSTHHAAASPAPSRAASMQRGVSVAKDEMNELGEALTERGERLKLLAAKMEAFKEQAGEYRQMTLEQNRKLVARSQAWGLGFF
jgi:hypothetical protein